jgi:voltage-gated potassium channel
MNRTDSNHHEEIGVFQIIVLILSIVVLGALFVDTACKLPPQITKIVEWVDTGVCFFLLVDFGIRLYKAKSKLQFWKWGWIDLIASIPNLPMLRVGRLVRVLRIIRLLRAIRATTRVSKIVFRNKIHGGVASLFITCFLLIMFSSVGILICEQDPRANIRTAEDAIWWSVATVTTASYSDLYPITTEGRFLGLILMIAGLGMVGVISGIMVTVFLGDRNQEPVDKTEIIERLKKLEEKIDKLKSKE